MHVGASPHENPQATGAQAVAANVEVQAGSPTWAGSPTLAATGDEATSGNCLVNIMQSIPHCSLSLVQGAGMQVS